MNNRHSIFPSLLLGHNDKWEIYQDRNLQWRWRRISPNGNIVGASAESYVNRIDCVKNAQRNGYLGN
jgi:uncharacterized protein YegP (UPF0339 family)